MRKKRTLAWHFVGATLRDGSPIPNDGEWLYFLGDCKLCKSGLHWSRNPFDALKYASGATLCLVEINHIIEEQEDKGVSRRRRIIARMDATDMLQYFARQQAISVLDNWQIEPDQSILDWLMGDYAAESAAESAARSAAWSAAKTEFTQLVYECFSDFLD